MQNAIHKTSVHVNELVDFASKYSRLW